MLISIEKIKEIYTEINLTNYSDIRLEQKLNALETTIRNYTNNHFQNINIRTQADCIDGVIYGDFKYFHVGDTVEISQGINKGLYVIQTVDNVEVTLDKTLFDDKKMVITKVEYPLDVIEGAMILLDYDINVRDNSKSNVSSESISRHSVSYKNMNDSNTIKGYPSELMGFLKGYCKWRT